MTTASATATASPPRTPTSASRSPASSPTSQLELYRFNGATNVRVNVLNLGPNVQPGDVIEITDPTINLAQGTYIYTVRQIDVAGNVSVFSAGLTIIIPLPGALPAPDLIAADDSGALNNDNVHQGQSEPPFHHHRRRRQQQARAAAGQRRGRHHRQHRRRRHRLDHRRHHGPRRRAPLPGPPDRPGDRAVGARRATPPSSPSTRSPRPRLGHRSSKPPATPAPLDGITAISTNLGFDVSGIETGGQNGVVELFRGGSSVVEARA